MEPEQSQKPSQLLPTQSELDLNRAKNSPTILGVQPTATPTTPSTVVGASPSAADNAATPTKKSVPDQATIDALLQVTRADQQRQDNAGGTRMHHWWNPAEWVDATPAMRKGALIKLALFIISSIVLTVFTNYVVSHAGKR